MRLMIRIGLVCWATIVAIAVCLPLLPYADRIGLALSGEALAIAIVAGGVFLTRPSVRKAVSERPPRYSDYTLKVRRRRLLRSALIFGAAGGAGLLLVVVDAMATWHAHRRSCAELQQAMLLPDATVAATAAYGALGCHFTR